ncbi:hypothetical protein GIB67_017703 [Kingdonia uniflora]|uniref:DUF659 domain-containing protein n=1 Tax=Kingdonia uniflora TaxID=39325 RepID=A0A7J7NA25_9MAGN|nr:hypothetical protein GIB67_017703 [Kingdonia uniflora]
MKSTLDELHSAKLDVVLSQQKLEKFCHGTKNINKMLCMRKTDSDKRGLGYDEPLPNAKTPQIIKFVKATTSTSVPKHNMISTTHNHAKRVSYSHIYYCSICGRKGELASYCRFVGPYQPYARPFNGQKYKSYVNFSNVKSKNLSRWFTPETSPRKVIRTVWMRKDDLLPQIRMSRSTGDFYDHCVKVGPKVVQYNYYNKIITVGITRFKEHLSTQRESVIECPNTPTDLRKLVIQALKEIRQNKRSRRQLQDWEPQGSSHDDSDEVENITNSFGGASEPDYHPEERSGGESQSTRIKSMGLLGRLFRCGRGSNEELTSRSSSSLRVLARRSVDLYSQNLRQETQQTIPNMMDGGSSSRKYACGKIASMIYENTIPFNVASSWKDKAKHTLVNFLVYYPIGITFLKSVDIDGNRLTADCMITLFKEIVDYVGAENIVQVVTNQGSNFKATAHVIDLVLEDLESFSRLKDTIGDARKISKFVYAHAWVLAMFKEHSNRRDRICPSQTRFATSFIAIRSIMENQVHLQQLFVDTEYKESSYAKLSTMYSKKLTKEYLFDALCTSRTIRKLPFKPDCIGSEVARIAA